MGTAGHESTHLERAIARGHLTAARVIATGMDRVSIRAATAMTLLIARKEPEKFEAAGRRLLARLASETQLSLAELAAVAYSLEQIAEEPQSDAANVLVRILER